MTMKHGTYWMGFVSLLLAACQGQDVPTVTDEEKLPMSVQAEIENSSSANARTSTTDGGAVSFVAGDKIGLFVPNQISPVVWTYSGSGWTPGKTVYWKDKTSTYDFYAYYPCSGDVSAVTASAVPMPDLSAQTGTLEKLGDYDFLVATQDCSYGTTGAVSFTGEHQFQHVLSMVSFTFTTNNMGDGVTLKSVQLSAEGLSARNTYDLLGHRMEASSVTETAIVAGITDNASVLLAVPVTAASFTVSVTYTIGEQQVTISQTAAETITLQQGKNHQLTVTVKQGGLSISGMEITNWTEGTALPGITVE